MAVALAVSAQVSTQSTTARRRAVVRGVKELFHEGITVAPDLGQLGRDTDLGQPATPGPVEEAVRRVLDEQRVRV
ncbi:hypothetical protein [Streptomyces sp. NPDC051219]|uniref:hypothetical protein n=1 Tax=Streptomyces sp. NPDC051219 TaxID=3155283 RepID=UPI003414381E